MPKAARFRTVNPSADKSADSHVPRLRTRFYAFLSYSHDDRELADWLHHELETLRVPHALAGKLTATGVVPHRLTPIFRDQHDLSAGGDLAEEIKAALAASQFLVVLCSPTAAKSRWTNAEIESFKRTRPEGCVLAAIAAGEPFATELPGREAEECFPPALRYKYDRRGRATNKRAEPLAADLRGGQEERRTGFLKLVAGMLGVGLDELVQREQTRRHRHLAWLAAASLAGMAVTSTLSVAAIQARDSARDQRREAEGLVEFMVGDLKNKLEPIGRLDALDGVGAKVLAYYGKQNAGQLSDAGLLQRSRALSLMAQVTYLRGNFDSADRLYREAMAGTEEAVRRNPNDPERLFEQAQNVFWIGDLARQRGRIREADAAYREYRRLAGRMVAIQPDNLRWRMEVLYADEDIGIILTMQRRFAEAARLFDRSLEPMQSLVQIDPGNGNYQQELANLLGWSADAERALGRFDEAIATRRRQIAFIEGLIARGGGNASFASRLITAHEGLGILLSSKGQLDAGVEQYWLALAQAGKVIANEPANSETRDVAANVEFELARNLLALAKTAEAAQHTSAACQVAGALRTRDQNVARWRMLNTTCLEMRSRLALASGAQSQALSLADAAVVAARSERSGDPIADGYAVAGAQRLLGDVRLRLGDRSGAMAAWADGLAGLRPNVSERPWEMDERAELLERLGRTAEARPLAATIAAIGYRRVT